MANELLIGIVGLLGVLLGAGAQAVGGHALAARQFQRDSQFGAYALFLKSMARISASPPGSKERWDAMAGLIEAKCQIALYGSESVVRKLSHFSRQHSIVNYDAFADLAEVIDAMRMDSGAERITDLSSELHGLLFDSPKIEGSA